MSISNKLGSSCYLIVAIVALVVFQPSSGLNANTANEVCNLLMDGINIFSGSSCDQYYTCMSGLATLASCSSGYYFSRDTQACQLSSLVTCSTDASPCANVANGEFLSVPDSCTNFYYCYNGVATMGSCPNGLNFDPVDQSCNYTTDYLCSSDSLSDSTETINFCSVVPNGYYFGSSSACNSWQECGTNGLITGVCPSPYYFNVETASCDYLDNVSCRQTNGVPITVTTGGALAGTSCSTNGLVVSDNQTCIGYYNCTNNLYVYNTCVGGLYFNPPTASCVNRVDAINNCNRCEGTSLTFVNLYQDNCVGYASCSNGRMASEGTCTDGYFNENLGACVQGGTEPLFPVCNVAMDSTSNSTSSTSSDSSTTSSGSTSSGSTSSGSTSSDSSSAGTTAAVTATSASADTTTASAETTTASAETTTEETTTTEATTTLAS